MKTGHIRHALTFLLIFCMLGFLASCSSSGGSGDIDDYKDGGTEDTGGDEPADEGEAPSSQPKKISISTSQVSVKSDDSDFATLTATVLDADNAVVENATVAFSADGGTLSPDPESQGDTSQDGPKSEVKTDESGKAKIRFSSGSIEKSNRVVSITAKVGGVSSVQIPITVGGTTVSLGTGKTNLELDDEDMSKRQAILTITVKDAGLQPIYDASVEVSLDPSSTGDASWELLPEYDDYRTDLSGQVRVEVTGTIPDQAIIKAESLGATATQEYAVGGVGEVFSIIDPTDDIVGLATGLPLTITVATPPGEYSVVFASTLGTWDGGSEKAVVKSRDTDTPTVSAVLSSSQAGLATVQVYREDDISRTDSLVVAMSAPSSEATQIALQATATVVLPSSEGVNNTVTLIATVKNASAQVVGGAPVLFFP